MGDWNFDVFRKRSPELNGDWSFASTPEDLVLLLESGLSPKYIFFVHWRWIVPKKFTESYDCICFHMTDLPYGRGGSPLQNLIVRGHTQTMLTSLKMNEVLDGGPIYYKYPLALKGKASEIYLRAAELSWDMINEIIANNPAPKAQSGPITMFARRVPSQSEIPDNLNIFEVFDYIRMLDADEYPRAFIKRDGYRMLFEDAVLDGDKITASVSIEMRDKKT